MISKKKMLEYIYGDSKPLSEKLAVDLSIDKNKLPEEWENQHQLYMEWIEVWAFSITERDRRKTAVELEEANMDTLIRSDPSAYDIEKITEGAIKAAIKNSDEYQGAVEELHKATLFMNRMAGAKTSFEQRKSALKHLTELAIAGFFSANSGPAEAQVKRSVKAREGFAGRMKSKTK